MTTHSTSRFQRPPARLAFAYKEWSEVCRALADGDQTILIRKGGVAETDGEFQPEHHSFWLYPTFLHQKQQGTKSTAKPDPTEAASGDALELSVFAVIDEIFRVHSLGKLELLQNEHVWEWETIYQRFHYRTPGVWVLLARFFRSGPHKLEVKPEYSGCKTWVNLRTEPLTAPYAPVLSDPEYERRRLRIVERLGPGSMERPPCA